MSDNQHRAVWPGKRRILWIELVLLILGATYLGFRAMPRAWRELNTDFPNYYLTAKLARQGYDTSRAYEWTWIQREKDHQAIDRKVIGLLPITPFSTLVMWPVAYLSPLMAKHIWLLINLALLIPLCYFLRSITSLSLQQAALLIVFSAPLQ